MATRYNTDHFDANGRPRRLNSAPSGDDTKVVTETIAETDEQALDFVGLTAILEGRCVKHLYVLRPILDEHVTPTGDFDVILRTELEDGTFNDQILFNGGVASAAVEDWLYFETEGANRKTVPASKWGYGVVGLLCNVVSADLVAGDLTVAVVHG